MTDPLIIDPAAVAGVDTDVDTDTVAPEITPTGGVDADNEAHQKAYGELNGVIQAKPRKQEDEGGKARKVRGEVLGGAFVRQYGESTEGKDGGEIIDQKRTEMARAADSGEEIGVDLDGDGVADTFVTVEQLKRGKGYSYQLKEMDHMPAKASGSGGVTGAKQETLTMDDLSDTGKIFENDESRQQFVNSGNKVLGKMDEGIEALEIGIAAQQAIIDDPKSGEEVIHAASEEKEKLEGWLEKDEADRTTIYRALLDARDNPAKMRQLTHGLDKDDRFKPTKGELARTTTTRQAEGAVSKFLTGAGKVDDVVQAGFMPTKWVKDVFTFAKSIDGWAKRNDPFREAEAKRHSQEREALLTRLDAKSTERGGWFTEQQEGIDERREAEHTLSNDQDGGSGTKVGTGTGDAPQPGNMFVKREDMEQPGEPSDLKEQADRLAELRRIERFGK